MGVESYTSTYISRFIKRWIYSYIFFKWWLRSWCYTKESKNYCTWAFNVDSLDSYRSCPASNKSIYERILENKIKPSYFTWHSFRYFDDFLWNNHTPVGKLDSFLERLAHYIRNYLLVSLYTACFRRHICSDNENSCQFRLEN